MSISERENTLSPGPTQDERVATLESARERLAKIGRREIPCSGLRSVRIDARTRIDDRLVVLSQRAPTLESGRTSVVAFSLVHYVDVLAAIERALACQSSGRPLSALKPTTMKISGRWLLHVRGYVDVEVEHLELRVVSGDHIAGIACVRGDEVAPLFLGIAEAGRVLIDEDNEVSVF